MILHLTEESPSVLPYFAPRRAPQSGLPQPTHGTITTRGYTKKCDLGPCHPSPLITTALPRTYLSQVLGIEKHESVHAELLGPVTQAVDDHSPDDGVPSAQHILTTAGGPVCGSGGSGSSWVSVGKEGTERGVERKGRFSVSDQSTYSRWLSQARSCPAGPPTWGKPPRQ